MNKKILTVVVILFTIVVLSGCLKPEINIQNLEMKIHNLINKERQNNGLPPLEYDSALSKIARAHSKDMVNRNYYSHYNLGGMGPTERAQAAGYNTYKDFGDYYTDGIAENICKDNLLESGYDICFIPLNDYKDEDELADSIVDAWMTSSGHYQNIMDLNYDREGIGVAISSNDDVLVTQDFW